MATEGHIAKGWEGPFTCLRKTTPVSKEMTAAREELCATRQELMEMITLE